MAYYFSTAEITVYRKILLDILTIYYNIISKSSYNTTHANLKARIYLHERLYPSLLVNGSSEEEKASSNLNNSKIIEECILPASICSNGTTKIYMTAVSLLRLAGSDKCSLFFINPVT